MTCFGNPRLLLILLIATAAAITPAFAQDNEWGPWDVTPSWFLRAELLSFGADAITFSDRGVLKVGLVPQISFCDFGGEWHGVKLGVSVMRTRMENLAGSILPLSVGYTILRRPYNYAGRLIGEYPEVYAQFTADWAYFLAETYVSRSGALELTGAIDRYGLGLSASLGIEGWYEKPPWSASSGHYELRPYLGFRVRLATLTAGF
jgi:hypothetical protein